MSTEAQISLGSKDTSWERERLLEALDAHQRGLTEAPLIRKWSQVEGESKDAGQDQPMSFVISTDDVDRHGDVIVSQGWRLESYRRKPVFLWAHDYARPVIGRAVDVRAEAHRLIAQVEFAPTDFAQEVAKLYRSGFQRGVSVGFKPLRYEERRHEKTGAFLGIRFLEQELLETSAVPVPANRDALRRALDETPQLAEYLRSLDQNGLSPQLDSIILASGLEGWWPELESRVDELSKLVEELVQILGQIDGAQAGKRQRGGVGAVLAALGGARW